MQSCLAGTVIYEGESPHHGPRQEAISGASVQLLCNKVHGLIIGHPLAMVKGLQVKGPGIAAEGLFPVQVVVMFKVGHDQLSKVAIHRLTKAEAGKVRFRDSAPMAVMTEERKHMVIVTLIRKQVQDQRRMTQTMQYGSGKDSAIKTLAGLIVQNSARRSVDRFRGIRDVVEEMLYLVRSLELCDNPGFCTAQTVIEVITC